MFCIRRPANKRRKLQMESLELRNLMAGLTAGDFNGDGKADLAMGFEFEDVSTITDAGAVNVIYGTTTGLSGSGNQFWHQNSYLVQENAEAGDRFGNELAAGDFNGDGRDDLLIGIPYENVGTKSDAGTVQVLYGSTTGLWNLGNSFFHLDQGGLPGTSDPGDLFGLALATGDFNNDGFDDAAISAPGDGDNIGSVTVIMGSATGLATTGSQWSLATPAIVGDPEIDDLFGSALAVGDINNDGFDDLAVGVPGRSTGRGVVNVIYGSATGLTANANQQFGLAVAIADFGDRFGAALAIADFNGDGFGELAVGVPGLDRNGFNAAGGINVFRGTSSGLSSVDVALLSQETVGIPDDSEQGDAFGNFLASGDFNLDGRADLVVSAPFESVGSVPLAGAMTIIPGTTNGLSGAGSQQWSQNTPGIIDVSEQLELFAIPTVGDFDGNGRTDLAIFTINESLGTIQGAGAANVIYAAVGGLSATGNQFWHQNSSLIFDVVEPNDGFNGFAESAASRQASFATTTLHLGYDADMIKLRKSRASGLIAFSDL